MLFILFMLPALAMAKAPIFPKTASYKQSLSHKPGELAAVDLFFKAQGYVKLRGQGALSNHSLAWLDRVFIVPKKNQFIFVKSGLKIDGIKTNVIYKHAKGHVVHFKSPGNTVTALFFKGFREDLVDSYRDQLTRRLKTASLWPRSFSLLATAHANSLEAGQAPCIGASPELAAGPTPATAGALEITWGCVQGAGVGLWDATVGVIPMLFQGALDTGWYLITTSGEQMWTDMNEQYERTQYIVQNFSSIMGEFATQFDALPPDIKAQVICEVVTMVGVPALFTIVTGGGTTPLLALKMAAAFEKVAVRTGNPRLAQIARDFKHYEEREYKHTMSIITGRGAQALQNAIERYNRDARALDDTIAGWHRHQTSLVTVTPETMPEWRRMNTRYREEIERLKVKAAESEANLARAKDVFARENKYTLRHATEIAGPHIYNMGFACLLTTRLTEQIGPIDTPQTEQ